MSTASRVLASALMFAIWLAFCLAAQWVLTPMGRPVTAFDMSIAWSAYLAVDLWRDTRPSPKSTNQEASK